MSCQVRDAGPADLATVQAIYAREVLNGVATFEELVPSIEEMRSRHRAIVDAGLPFLVAQFEGRVVGYSYAAAYRARTAYRYTLEDSVYVAADWMGRGIGRALLAGLLERCEAGPWRQMVAIIGDSANRASIALHRRLGFREVGTLVSAGFKLGRWVDTVLMQRALGVGDASRPDPMAGVSGSRCSS